MSLGLLMTWIICPPRINNNKYFSEKSLMTELCIKNALTESMPSSLNYLGFKIIDLPFSSSLDRRISLNRDFLVNLDNLMSKV